MTHATVGAYTYHGCRCSRCTGFMRDYWRARKAHNRPRRPRPDIEKPRREARESPPLIDPASARVMALRLLRRADAKATGQRYDDRHGLRDGSGERMLVRLLRGLRWGVTHAGPTPAPRITETTEDRLWVML